MAGQKEKAMQLINQAIDILTTSSSSSSSDSGSQASTSSAVSHAPSTSTLSELPKLIPSFRTSAKPVLSPFQSGLRWKPYKIEESWTHQFVCVAENDQESIPSMHLKCQLTNAGLGEKKVIFNDKKCLWQHVKSVLEHEYPKLKDIDGAFEILRSSGSRRSLEVIPIPPKGYTVPYLKEALGQAIGYVRPLQKNLDNSPILNVSKSI